MAKYTLHIETEDATELAEIALKLAGGAPEFAHFTKREQEAEIDALLRRDHSGPSSGPRQVDPETAAAEEIIAPAGEEKKRRGRPPKVRAEEAPGSPGEPPAAAPAPTPAATVVEASPAPAPAAAAAVPAEITYDALKALLTEVLKQKSAKDAQDAIRAATQGTAAGLTGMDTVYYPAVYAELKRVLG